jgi:hypothetical protein
VSIETLRADPGYMAGCKEFNPISMNEQAGYQGIYPFITTQEEVSNILGTPLRINEFNEISWEYGKLDVVFDKKIVSELYVVGDDVTTLKDLIVQYGCPDVIYALDINEHPFGEYSRLLFLYPSIGFDFTIDHIPAKMNDIVYDMRYFKPGALDDYKNMFFTLSVPNASKPMTWDRSVH